LLEHEDEYLAGAGQKAANYAASYNGMPTTAHGIVVHGDAYLLGGGLLVHPPRAVRHVTTSPGGALIARPMLASLSSSRR
jgi:hypothetical protein